MFNRSKFNVGNDEESKQKRTYEGRLYASEAEMYRYQELQRWEAAGLITDLRQQPRYKLFLNDRLITTYIADFEYRRAGALVIEDVKGVLQRDTEIKLRLMVECGHPAVRLISRLSRKDGSIWRIQTGKNTRILEGVFDPAKDSGYVP